VTWAVQSPPEYRFSAFPASSHCHWLLAYKRRPDFAVPRPLPASKDLAATIGTSKPFRRQPRLPPTLREALRLRNLKGKCCVREQSAHYARHINLLRMIGERCSAFLPTASKEVLFRTPRTREKTSSDLSLGESCGESWPRALNRVGLAADPIHAGERGTGG
jgi:hypothetical protein